ncbi:MAG TPA: PEP-CTERM sorting domain-containing protein [Lacipirellulaceae bacterium]|nr:PEP-CTERM sorting domain-containing protein [Lacipirellulaceae bacterium]
MKTCCFSLSLAAVVLAASAIEPARADTLYIGDAGDNLVKRFDVATGARDAGFTTSGLLGPNGMLIDGDRLIVVNQNVNTHLSGEVLAFDKETGASLGPIIAESAKDAPYVPRGIVLGPGGDDLFVGNFSTSQGKSHGSLLRYDLSSSVLLSDDKAKGFQNHDFHPRGVVFGPDGMLYAASPVSLKTGLGGAVLRFDADGTFSDVVLEDEGGFGQLNRPEGIVFGPDGNLYVTSFRAAPGDKDGVRVYDPATGDFLRQIDFYDDPVNDFRVSAQAILFGPEGKLYAPMLQTGEVRAYDMTTGDYTTFIAGGTELINPFFMTFGQTDPSTLAYGSGGAGLSASAVSVPEPASAMLTALVLAGLIGWSRSRRR